jgi:hypothetical protein
MLLGCLPHDAGHLRVAAASRPVFIRVTDTLGVRCTQATAVRAMYSASQEVQLIDPIGTGLFLIERQIFLDGIPNAFTFLALGREGTPAVDPAVV